MLGAREHLGGRGSGLGLSNASRLSPPDESSLNTWHLASSTFSLRSMSVWSGRGRRGQPPVEARIHEALADLRPMLRNETMGIELVEFQRDTGVAVLRFEGDCPDCEMSASMLREGIEAHLRMRVPEIREVRAL